MSENEKKHSRLRLVIQLASAALLNGYAAGFTGKKIFTGGSKAVCVPVLNCYSCPGALGSCPIGALQAVAGGRRHSVSFYVLGSLMLFGTLLGRLLCGFICPFGLVQDLLYKIPVKKLTVPKKLDKPLRWLKHLILLLFVLLLPVLAVNKYGVGEPWFCKYICPAGTLQGGVPHLLFNEQLRRLAGVLFSVKMGILIGVAAASVFISRFFCRYLCPLGAFYSLFNRFALYQLSVDKQKCTHCGKCDKVCPMALEVKDNINCGECIRCGKCKAACPEKAIS